MRRAAARSLQRSGQRSLQRSLLLALLLALPACAAQATPSAADRTQVVVFAAASLTEAFTALEQEYEAAHPEVDVRSSFAGSQALVAQVEQGAPADLVVTADEQSMARLAPQLEGTPRVLARNALAIVTAPGDPQRLTTLAALARPGVRVVLAQPGVPAGRAARAALAAAGADVRPVSEEPDVKAVVAKVRLGEADAGVAYATDLRAAAPAVGGTALPGAVNAYPAAVVRDAAHAEQARAFLAYVAGPPGQRLLAGRGFLPA